MTHQGTRRAQRWIVAFLAVLAVAAPACSKRPAAPALPGPTRFIVLSSDRGRTDGSYRNFFTTLDGAGASMIEPRTTIGIIDRHPSITQDGRVLCYESNLGRGGSKDVLLYNRSSNTLTVDSNVNSTLDETDPQISLDGTRLVFVRDSLGLRSIKLYDLVNQRLIPLPGLAAPGFSDWEPAIDAPGRRIAFTTNRTGTLDVMVYRMNTLALDPASALQSNAGDVEPSFSGDGRYVIFASNRTSGTDYDLLLFDLNNGLLVPLPSNTNSQSDDRDPSIGYDGSIVVFASNRAGQGGFDLWNLNRLAGVLTQPSGEVSSDDDLEPFLVWP